PELGLFWLMHSAELHLNFELRKVPDYESGGQEFESLRARQQNKLLPELQSAQRIASGQTMDRTPTCSLILHPLPSPLTVMAERNSAATRARRRKAATYPLSRRQV